MNDNYNWKRFFRTNGRWSGWHLCNENNECKCGWVYLPYEFTKTEIKDTKPYYFVCAVCELTS